MTLKPADAWVYKNGALLRRVVTPVGPPVDPPPPPPPPDPVPPVAIQYGALPIGTANFPVPTTALYVAPTGSDTNNGALTTPFATIKKAMAVALTGGTVVVRAGNYFEGGVYPNLGGGIGVTNANVTLQAYPGEAVWLDGSVIVTGWVQSGAAWRAPFVQTLDRAPTQTRGEQLSAQYGSFTVVEFPCATWPEMCLVDGVQLTQVDDVAKVGPGKFFVEGAYPNSTGTDRNAFASSAYVIGDDPAGKEVRIGKLARAMSISKTGVTLRGIGFRRYVPSLPDFGALFISSATGADFAMEHVVVEDVSVLGVSMNSLRGHLSHITVQRCGQTGLGGTQCDDAILEYSLLKNNVFTRFNYGPDAGGLKWTRCQRPIIRFNQFIQNYGHDCWLDESVYKGVIHGNYFRDSYGKGVAYEIGDSGLIVDNIFINQGIASTDIASRKPHESSPIWLSGSNRCRVWHNTAINPEKPCAIAQDYRRPLAPGSFGRDPRQPDSFYQTEMTWNVQSVEVKNNAFIGTAGMNQVQSVFYSFFDSDKIKSTQDYGPDFAGNLYTKPDGTHPARFANGYKGSDVVAYFNLTGAPSGDTVPWSGIVGDAGSKLVANVNPLISPTTGWLSTTYLNQVTPAPVPADVAALLAVSPFTRQRVGAGYLA